MESTKEDEKMPGFMDKLAANKEENKTLEEIIR